MPRLVADRRELERLVNRIGGVDAEDVIAFALGEDEQIDPYKLTRIEKARAELYDVAVSPLWAAIAADDND